MLLDLREVLREKYTNKGCIYHSWDQELNKKLYHIEIFQVLKELRYSTLISSAPTSVGWSRILVKSIQRSIINKNLKSNEY